MRLGLADTITSIVGLTIILILVLMAIFAQQIAPYDPTAGSLLDRLKPPFWQEGGSTAHLLGTDVLGRDTLSRLIFGARTSLAVAVIAILVAGTIGSTLGIIAGYLGGWADIIIMRAADLAFSFPTILLAMVLAVIFGASFANIILVIALVLWAEYARMARGESLKIKSMDYVALARVAGVSKTKIMARHILPNISSSLIVLATLQVGVVIILESSLSFLGVGMPPPTPDWGAMISEGRSYVVTAWWLSLVPGVAILLTVLSFNLLGDALTEWMNPSSHRDA
ncbi:MAG: ABC transporter permease [Chloroflexi bacterium]|nr:ABC transporter permease [Chloroflexota bacterium]